MARNGGSGKTFTSSWEFTAPFWRVREQEKLVETFLTINKYLQDKKVDNSGCFENCLCKKNPLMFEQHPKVRVSLISPKLTGVLAMIGHDGHPQVQAMFFSSGGNKKKERILPSHIALYVASYHDSHRPIDPRIHVLAYLPAPMNMEGKKQSNSINTGTDLYTDTVLFSRDATGF